MRRHGCPLIRDACPSPPPLNAYRSKRGEMQGGGGPEEDVNQLSGKVIVVGGCTFKKYKKLH